VIETIAAGSTPKRTIHAGECSRIMTGAPLPKGADIVVMFEDTRVEGNIVYVIQLRQKSNIRGRGEEMKKGSVALRKGTLCSPAELAVLASCGKSAVEVYRRPRVGIIATGDELVEPSVKPGPGHIRNSNGIQLCAQVTRAGCLARYFGIARDTEGAVEKLIRKALKTMDVVILSGGVSAGDFDVVPDVLRRCGARLLFEKVAIKPGKPTVFGIAEDSFVFGLPGNPVSTFVIFELLVRPFLMKLCGREYTPKKIRLPLHEKIVRKNAGRLEFIPARITKDGFVERIEYHGSAHIHAFTQADGIVAVPEGVVCVESGTKVDVAML
jgi:molybdopterin molybdotransferase